MELARKNGLYYQQLFMDIEIIMRIERCWMTQWLHVDRLGMRVSVFDTFKEIKSSKTRQFFGPAGFFVSHNKWCVRIDSHEKMIVASYLNKISDNRLCPHTMI